jgi:hypothetical protein
MMQIGTFSAAEGYIVAEVLRLLNPPTAEVPAGENSLVVRGFNH